MGKNISKNQLFKDFPGISTKIWEEKIKSDLKGADYERKLIRNTDEGIRIKPYYREENLEKLRYLENTADLKKEAGAPNGWKICQDVDPGSEPDLANEKARAALKGGAQALRIQLGKAPNPDMAMLRLLLDGISLKNTELMFQGYLGADAIYDILTEFARESGVETADLKGCIGADPLCKMALTGVPLVVTGKLGQLVARTKEHSPELRVLDVNGGLFQDAGGNLVEELAFTLSMANEYLAILTDQGTNPADAVASMQISMVSGPNYFMEIAKLRAARILWSAICSAYGLSAAESKIRIHATSSQWNMSLYDPQVNMLRGCTEAMSSILGGADMLSVLPYNHPYEDSSLFADRIARNIQIILRDEAYLERVTDPSAGSYYIENLTDDIAEKAWELFRELEAEGGYRKALQKGLIQGRIETSRQKKEDRLTSGRDHLLGTNAYPNFNEFILEQIKGEQEELVSDAPLKAIRPFRLSASFDSLRLDTEKNGMRPKVFLFKYGNPAWATARATFAGNFFACAGYEILDGAAFGSIDEGIEAAKQATAEVVVLCSSDDSYTDIAEPLASALNKGSLIVVAGNPKEQMEALGEAGITDFIHMKSNLLESLQNFNKNLLQTSK